MILSFEKSPDESERRKVRAGSESMFAGTCNRRKTIHCLFVRRKSQTSNACGYEYKRLAFRRIVSHLDRSNDSESASSPEKC